MFIFLMHFVCRSKTQIHQKEQHGQCGAVEVLFR